MSGSTFETTWSQPGSEATGTMTPESSICGAITAGMNCTASNSLRANVDRKMPRFTAARASSSSMPKRSATLPALWTFSTHSEKTSTSIDWTTATAEKPSM